MRHEANRLLLTLLLGWTACAIVTLVLTTAYRAQALMWPASGFMVTALLVAAPNRRARVLAAFAATSFAVNYAFGQGDAVHCAGFALANAGEGFVTATIARRFYDQRAGAFVTLRQLLGLTAAAIAGATASALVSLPFRQHSDIAGTGWWMASVALGTLSTVPLLLGVLGPARVGSAATAPRRGLMAVTGAAFGISLLVLSTVNYPLLFAVMSLTVFASARFGQPGAAVCLLGFAGAAAFHSIGGVSPVPLLGLSPRSAAIALQVYMFVVLATAMPLAALLGAQEQLGALLLRRNRRLLHHITLLRMAQQLTGMGRWHLSSSGTLTWSKETFQLYDLPQRANPDMAEVRTRLADGEDFFTLFDQFRDTRDQYTFEYRVVHGDGHERVLQLRGVNDFGAGGALEAIYGVVLDVTDQRRHEAALDQARDRAVLMATEARLEAETDVLTGLANRRRTFDQLGHYLDQSGGEDSLSIISIDIDFFKAVNDTYGHPVGDEVLRRVARIACGEVRASDLIGRVGGEEFVWLMPGASIDTARAAAERLRHAIEIGSAIGGLPRVTASIGCAQWQPGDTADTLLARADRALYDAKEGGRNQVRRAA